MSHEPSRLDLLPVACPPALASALGFASSTRHVALFRSHVTGDVVWMDSQRMARVNEGPFCFLLEHALLRDSLRGFYLGARGREAAHWLLADRVEEALYVGAAVDVATRVRPLGAADGASSRWTACLEEMRSTLAAHAGDGSSAQRDADALEEAVRQRLLTNRLTAWLDGEAPTQP